VGHISDNVYKEPSVGVIGAGFSGLSAAAVLASKGINVEVFEKNADTGGRARQFTDNGLVFDMGPSWYWMPDVFERFFNLFGHTASDFYQLKKLDPGFRIVYGKDDVLDVPENEEELYELFETEEKGSSVKLKKFLREAEYKYHKGIHELVYQPGLSIRELLDVGLLKDSLRLQVFSSFSRHVRKYFKSPRLIALLEFPVLFLGAMPEDTPALYSLMNYAGLKLGTYYPLGGFGKVADAFRIIAEKQGVKINTSAPVDRLEVQSGKIKHIHSKGESKAVSAVLGAADYHHVENKLLQSEYKVYSDKYWSSRTFAPSCLIFYLGINKKLDKLLHHNLFFDESLGEHAIEIYKNKKWPQKPLFYVCCPSRTDDTVAPPGHENLFILMPVAIGLQDTPEIRESYYSLILDRIERLTGERIAQNVVYKRSYSVNDFETDYHAYGGNAYGLANTLRQTAILKPKMRSRKVKNLFFAGQLTVPGPGVPPAIISGQVAANELIKHLKNKK
jgi:phytoene desaturase